MTSRAFLLIAVTGCVDPIDPAGAPPTPEMGQIHPNAAGTWTPLTNQPPFIAGVPLLQFDGTVMVHNVGTENWWQLTPDINGDYLKGNWTQLASMPAGYQPIYFATSVLTDGRVIAEGGEYLGSDQAFTSLGAIYDPAADSWKNVNPPPGWVNIGDASGMVLPDGTFMLSDALTDESALFNATSLTWAPTGAGKSDINDEESWTLLPDDTIFTVDCGATRGHAEIYDPAAGTWSAAGMSPVALSDPQNEEIGPSVLRYDGTVLVVGGTGANAIYDTKTKQLTAAPSFPIVASGQLDVADGPGALLPNGNVLVIASPGLFQQELHAFEWDGAAFNEVAAPPNAANQTSFSMTMLVLPTGQVMLTGQSGEIDLYTPAAGTSENAIPTITSSPKLVTADDPDPLIPDDGIHADLLPVETLYAGRSYKLKGVQLNGLSQGAYYGDDVQTFSNYPIVRFTNQATNHVTYARSHDRSSTSIAVNLTSTTFFDVPATAEPGVSKMEVVANGIASPAMLVNIK